MNFSTNQNRQTYVAAQIGTVTSHVSAITNNGDIGVFSVGEGNCKEMFFILKNLVTGEIIKSDRIPLKNLDYVKVIKASDLATKMRKVEVTLDSNVNSGNPIAGEDYVLRINLRQWIGMSDQDQYFKDAVVHATSGMSKSDFYKKMVESLNLSFSREIGASKTANPYFSFSVDNNSTATKIIIEEKPQEWALGTQAQERVLFDIVPTTVYDGGDDVIWGTVTEVSPTTTVGNGKKIADLEWFCMGERGDQYRMAGWPNYIPTAYSVDPTKTYDVIELHFAFTDTGVNSYRSEKDITIVAPVSSTSDHEHDAINGIIDEIEYHTGLTIAGLSE